MLRAVLLAALLCCLGAGERTELDHLKADILKYVLEKEEAGEEAETALQILQFTLGTRQTSHRCLTQLNYDSHLEATISAVYRLGSVLVLLGRLTYLFAI